MAIPLHVERIGSGPDLVLLHGWGMHSGIWRDAVDTLQQSYRLHLVDLPGHGRSQAANAEFDLAQLAEVIWQSVSGELKQPAFWLGWSLGGLAVMQIALQHSANMRGLILVATSPRFTRADDWHDAMSPDVLEMFAGQLAEDQEATLQRFLALQVKGSNDARESLRRLRQQVLENAALDPAALQSGLAILQQSDLRKQLHELGNLPVLQIFGERDMLVPAGGADRQAALFNNARTLVIDGAGHAPFVSDKDEFMQQVKVFLDATR